VLEYHQFVINPLVIEAAGLAELRSRLSTAGALLGDCRAAVLLPGLSRGRFDRHGR